MAVTAHFVAKDVNGSLVLHSRLVAFRAVPERHTGEHLAKVFYGIFEGVRSY